jgi:hypothetical protein
VWYSWWWATTLFVAMLGVTTGTPAADPAAAVIVGIVGVWPPATDNEMQALTTR